MVLGLYFSVETVWLSKDSGSIELGVQTLVLFEVAFVWSAEFRGVRQR